MTSGRPIRVLIVDDSAVVRRAMSSLISAAPDLEVMATASDPFQAAERLRHEVPDVITLDLEMPRMDGLTFLRRLMAQRPLPVVVCSSRVGQDGRTMMTALEAGAVDVIAKPSMATRQFLEESAIRIRDVIRAAALARLDRPRGRTAPAVSVDQQTSSRQGPARPSMPRTTTKVVAIGASTGGTEALRLVLEGLPPVAPPILIVQHMPAHFTRAFAERLDRHTAIEVREARDGDRVIRGQALIAPGGWHMSLQRVSGGHVVRLEDGPLVNRHRPSVDVLFRSVARHAGADALGLIMTGMGDDGALGLLEMRAAGALTIGQDEASSIVYGMPKAALRLGAVAEEHPLHALSGLIVHHGQEAR